MHAPQSAAAKCITAGAELIITYPLRSILVYCAVGLLMIALGIPMARNRLPSRVPEYLGGKLGTIGGMLVFFGSLLVLVLAPSDYFTERIVISRDSYCATNGFWFRPLPAQRFAFADIRAIGLFRDASGHDNLQFHHHDGTVVQTTRSDLWRHNETKILAALRQHNIDLLPETRASSAH